MIKLRRYFYYKLWGMFAIDAAIFTLALIGAYMIWLDIVGADFRGRHLEQIKFILSIAIPLKIIVFYAFGAYRGMWRYTGIRDLVQLAKASVTGTLVIIMVLVYYNRFTRYSRAVFIFDVLFTFILTSGARISIRFGSKLLHKDVRTGSFWSQRIPKGSRTKAIIIGAGDAGARILHETRENINLNYNIVCFLDDDPGKIGRAMHGVPVFGSVDTLPQAIARYEAKEVLIAVPSASGAGLRRMVEVCEKSGCPFKTLPTLSEIMDGSVSIKQLRDVDYKDLLGRPPVQLDTAGIADYIRHKAVLVTGAGGSIGSELCRQIVGYNPKILLLMDSSEFNLYQIEVELRHEMRFEQFKAILGQVQDRGLLQMVMNDFRPEVVFHAAAYKHVPMLEGNPWEAVQNNIDGSLAVMEASRQHEVERFVLVSTDKAVHPTNIMGASKRVAEILLQLQPSCKTRFMAVRFGNVLGSSGSVVPLFRRQIQRGGPVTVTHPEVTRFFMTIPEAVQLILQSGCMGKGGEIFVLDMGTPVKILDMARDLIRLSGKEPDRDIEIIFTGLRPGEKLYEELITKDEWVSATRHEKIKLLRISQMDESSLEQARNQTAQRLKLLTDAAAAHDSRKIAECMRSLVPEYHPEAGKS